MRLRPLAFALVGVGGAAAASVATVACSWSSSRVTGSEGDAGSGGGSDSGSGDDGWFDDGPAEGAPDASCSDPSTVVFDGGDGGLCMLTQSGTYTLQEKSDAASCPNVMLTFTFNPDAGVCGSTASCTCSHSEARCTVTTTENGTTTTQTTDYTYTSKGYTGTVSSTTTDADGGVISTCTYSVTAIKNTN